MEALEAILTRRSTRKYKDDMPDGSIIEKIIEAGRYAPSGSNSQNTHFIVFNEKHILTAMADLVREEFSKMCGDVTLKINNTSVSRSDKKDSDANRTTNTQTVTRPLIEPYELGQLPYDVNIVKIYGQPAIKTRMTQWFKVPLFSKEKAEDVYVPAKFFDENAIRYDVAERNKKVLKTSSNPFDFDF